MIDQKTGYFFALTPDRVLEAVESAGLKCTGRCLALNSFENRVYDVELERDDEESAPKNPSENRRVVKFYRPGRWTQAQILEEHEYLLDLAEAEISVICPVHFSGATLQTSSAENIWFALFPKVGGRAPDELNRDQLIRVGRLLGRIHNVGAKKKANYRVHLNTETYGLGPLEFLLKGNWIPLEFQKRYQEVVEQICSIAKPWFKDIDTLRIHGDCHLGNLLWNSIGPFFLDFDDMVVGPAVQDLWLLTPSRDQQGIQDREFLIEGYQEFRTFNRKELRLIEPLRALRFVHYTAWIARRWTDPAFPMAFPQFGTHQYWSHELKDLEEQLRLISNERTYEP